MDTIISTDSQQSKTRRPYGTAVKKKFKFKKGDFRNISSDLRPEQKLFFAIFKQAENDVYEFGRLLNRLINGQRSRGKDYSFSGKYDEYKRSIAFCENKNNHFWTLASIAGIDLSSKRVKDKINTILYVAHGIKDRMDKAGINELGEISRPQAQQAQQTASQSYSPEAPALSQSPLPSM